MKYYILLLITFASFSKLVEAQDIYDKMTDEVCHCIQDEQVKTFNAMKPCFMKTWNVNFDQIMEFHHAKNKSEISGEEVSKKMIANLTRKCDYFYNVFKDSTAERKTYTADSTIDCSSLKTGKFYYLSGKSTASIKDTTFVTVTDKEYIESMKKGTTYSKLTIEWTDSCSYVLTFVESNDPFKKEMSIPGDQFEYTIIKNSNASFIVKYNRRGETWYSEHFKLK